MEATTKQRYSKPQSVKILESLADAEARRLHPTCPALAPRKFRDDTANSLTRAICEYIRLKKGFASRLNNQGTYSRKRGRYIPSTSRKGLPDVLATYKGRSLFIEVKCGADRMSVDQMRICKEQTASGGLYFVADCFSSFKEWFDEL